MRRREFRNLVKQALDGLPAEFLRRLDNLAITIEDWPSDEELKHLRRKDRLQLLGLYVGVPLIDRSSSYNLVLPDRIILYQKNIEATCESEEEVQRQVQLTVAHEIAHHFGLSDEELARLGLG